MVGCSFYIRPSDFSVYLIPISYLNGCINRDMLEAYSISIWNMVIVKIEHSLESNPDLSDHEHYALTTRRGSHLWRISSKYYGRKDFTVAKNEFHKPIKP